MKQNKTNESGRSMVEMLGVLAVIGVLSVGGVAGYRYAMTQILENKILNLISVFRASIDIEEDVKESPYFAEGSGISVTDYFCEHYLGDSVCSKKQSEGRYFFSGKNHFKTYVSDSVYGHLFCLDMAFSSTNRALCRSLVAKTYSMDNISHWFRYHHYRKVDHTSEKIQDVLCRTENDGGRGEVGVGFCFF